MKIVVTRPIAEEALSILRSKGDVAVGPDEPPIPTADEVTRLIADADVVYTLPANPVNGDAIRGAKKLRMIATMGTGYDNIDVGAAKERGIPVTFAPGILDETTADGAFALLLATARRLGEAERFLRAGKYRGWTPFMFTGQDVHGATLGIVGMGRIGLAVAKRARAFDMKIHYHNRSRLTPEQEQGAVFHARAEDMLPHCDFLSLNAPATAETTGFLNAARIKLLPDGAVVVNTARGPLVDDEALIAALKSGKLFAAGLDVFTGEPAVNPAYRPVPNTFLLPHLGSATTETRVAMGMKAVDNLDAFFAGKRMPAGVV